MSSSNSDARLTNTMYSPKSVTHGDKAIKEGKKMC